MGYLLALKQETTSSPALVLDCDGQVKGAVKWTFAQHSPQPGWVERAGWWGAA